MADQKYWYYTYTQLGRVVDTKGHDVVAGRHPLGVKLDLEAEANVNIEITFFAEIDEETYKESDG